MSEKKKVPDRSLAEDLLTPSSRGKILSRQHVYSNTFLIFPENRIRHFMQIVSTEDKVHEMSNPIFCGKYHQFVVS